MNGENVRRYTQQLLADSKAILARTAARRKLSRIDELRIASRVYRGVLDHLDLSERSRQGLLTADLTSDEIRRLRFRDCPSHVLNLLICAELAKQYGRLDLVEGFVRTTTGAFMLDLRPQLASSGLLAAQLGGADRILGLRVFRSIADQRSFLLCSRSGSRGCV